MTDIERIYATAMEMSDENKSGYEVIGKNKDGFPILECKDGSHSLQLIITDFGKTEEVLNNKNKKS